MLSVAFKLLCRYVECRYTECRYVECVMVSDVAPRSLAIPSSSVNFCRQGQEPTLDGPPLGRLRLYSQNVTRDWKDLPGTNTLAYSAHS
jgi:hypothetical protein